MFREHIQKSSSELISSVNESLNIEETLLQLEKLCEVMREAISRKSIVYFFGNGGSAAEATHIAAEFSSFCVKRHDPWGAISLNDSISSLTAISNDYNFESVFERQISGLAKKGDLVIGLSTSGTSLNVLNALKKASSIGCYTVLLTSIRKQSPDEKGCNLVIRAASKETTRIQEIHLFWLHSIIEYLEINS
jgi:D-sedoheptulose 7-phosphate isomerase